MNGFDLTTFLNFFIDPSVGCCCCIPIVGFLTFAAGITHLSKQNALRFEARLAQVAGSSVVAPKSH